jgi:cytochrome o ubiquinol oxidase subunit IV
MNNIVSKNQTSISSSHSSDNDFESSILNSLIIYLIGFVLSVILTVGAFFIAQSDFIWAPAIPVALTALAIAQIGVQLVFFLHLTTGSDNINNSLALAFGTLVVALVIGGTLWIMSSMNHHMFEKMPAEHSMHNGHAQSYNQILMSLERIYADQSYIGKTVIGVSCVAGQRVERNQGCLQVRDDDILSLEDAARKKVDLSLQNVEANKRQLKELAIEMKDINQSKSSSRSSLSKKINQIKDNIRSSESELRRNQAELERIQSYEPGTLIRVPVGGVLQDIGVNVGDKISGTETELFGIRVAPTENKDDRFSD